MLVDGIEIERLENESCYVVDNNYVVVADAKGGIKYSFNLKHNNENTQNLAKEVAQKCIIRYDVIKKIQEDIK